MYFVSIYLTAGLVKSGFDRNFRWRCVVSASMFVCGILAIIQGFGKYPAFLLSIKSYFPQQFKALVAW